MRYRLVLGLQIPVKTFRVNLFNFLFWQYLVTKDVVDDSWDLLRPPGEALLSLWFEVPRLSCRALLPSNPANFALSPSSLWLSKPGIVWWFGLSEFAGWGQMAPLACCSHLKPQLPGWVRQKLQVKDNHQKGLDLNAQNWANGLPALLHCLIPSQSAYQSLTAAVSIFQSHGGCFCAWW